MSLFRYAVTNEAKTRCEIRNCKAKIQHVQSKHGQAYQNQHGQDDEGHYVDQ